ncbi:MAG: DNA-processing protein DprA [Bacteroidales bacterium]|nr:DNA-processing protein DprA [Bacteroidales bacterium]
MCEIKDVQAIYSFMKIRGIGVTRTNKELLSYTQQLGSMWKLEDWLLSVLTAEQKAEYYSQYEMVEGLKIKSLEVFFNTVLDQSYPSMLKNLLKLNTPPVLSMIGNVQLLTNRKVGFSGSRKVSEKGIAVTRDCVEQLSREKDVSIVSGYAQGVDKEAHYTALQAGGSTIIVLPNGISSFYVRQELKDVWDWNRVLVISEYLPKDKWSVSRAMNRNNTIIGLSDAMVVVEAGLTGGSLDAGLRSLEDKKPLFVPVYSDYPESALGNRMLLEKGAKGIGRNRQSNRANVMALF